MATKEDVINVMKGIYDPELNVDVWTLGLIYTIDMGSKDHIHIKMTLTSPMCPFGPQILAEVADGLKKLGYSKPEIELTFDPVWKPSEEVKMILGLD